MLCKFSKLDLLSLNVQVDYCFMNNQAGLINMDERIRCVSYDKVEVENGLYTKRVKRNCRPLGITDSRRF